MIKRHSVALSFLALIAASCATQAQRQFQEMNMRAEEAFKANEACYDAAEATPAGQRTTEFLITKANDPEAIQKMAINRYVTDEEKQVIIDYRNSVQPCRSEMIEAFSKIHPDFVNLLAKWYAKNDEDILRIVEGEVTIGESNKDLNNLIPKRRAEWTRVSEKVVAQLQSAHQSEMQNRAATAAALQRWSYQQQLLHQNQQMINALQRSTFTQPSIKQTNCRFIGSTLNCTTY